MPLLEADGLVAGYGAVPVIHDISISVGEAEIVAVLGANGAGKTTTLRAMAGLLRPSRGSVVFAGRSLLGLPPEGVAAAGLQFIPEGGGVLRDLTVLENLRLSAWLVARSRAAVAPRLERAFALFPRLAERQKQQVSTLSGGERQMLALSQALMTDARLVMIDEASLGLAPVLVAALFEGVKRLRDEGRSILLVEQNAFMALRVADRAYVMEKGFLVDSGAATDLLAHGRLAGAYLGDAGEEGADAGPSLRRGTRTAPSKRAE